MPPHKTMALSTDYFRRPQNAEIEDRDEAQETLEALLRDDTDVSWVQFRYRIIRGGAGLARSEEDATARGVDRDLDVLTLEDTGTLGIDELRRNLPPHEIAYVVYNNSKGARYDDLLKREQIERVGSRWKKWQSLRNSAQQRALRVPLLGWSGVVESQAREAECARLLALARDLNIFLPADVPVNEPIKLIEVICLASPNLHKKFKEGLDRCYNDVSDDMHMLQVLASGFVAEHLEKMNTERLDRVAKEERMKKEKLEQRRLQKARVQARNEGMNRGRRLIKDQHHLQHADKMSITDSASIASIDTDLTFISDGEGDDSLWDPEPLMDTRSVASAAESPLHPPSKVKSFARGSSRHSGVSGSLESPLQSPLKGKSFARGASRQTSIRGSLESPLQSPSRRSAAPSPLNSHAKGQKTLQPVALSTFSENDHGSVTSGPSAAGDGGDKLGVGRDISGLSGFSGIDSDAYDSQDNDEDAYFRISIEEEAKRLAVVMEQSAHKIQAVGRGYLDRKRVREVKRGMGVWWDEKLLKARQHHVIVVLIWTPSSTSRAMRELPLYHVRDIIDLMNDAETAAKKTELQPPNDMAEGPLMSGSSFGVHAQDSFVSMSSSNDFLDRDGVGNKAQDHPEKYLPLIPYVVHKARAAQEAMPICIAKTISQNYYGAVEDSDDSDTEVPVDDVVHFGEQELYQQLVKKYADLLESAGISLNANKDSHQKWTERLETKSLAIARAEYKARRKILRLRSTEGPKGMLASRLRSRMVQQQQSSEKEDLGDTILDVAKPGLRDLKTLFVHKPWWSLTFPCRDRQECLQDVTSEIQASVSRTPSHSISRTPSQHLDTAQTTNLIDLHDDEDEMEKVRNLALERIMVLSDTSTPLVAEFVDPTKSPSMREGIKSRQPELKFVCKRSNEFCTLGAKDFRELYAIRCTAMKVNEHQGNLQSFMHTIAHSCSNTRFNLVDMGLGTTCIAFLLSKLSHKVITLKELNLSCNPLGDAGATRLSAFLMENRTLTSLTLESALIGPGGQAILFKALQTHNFRIESLNLGGTGTPLKNVLGEAGAQAASVALNVNTRLSFLSLAENRMSASQLHILSTGLSKNLQLTKLDLSNNVFGDSGVCALSTALETLLLTELNLSRTGIHDDGACALAQALSSWRPPVHTLLLSNNCIAHKGARAFATVMSHNNTVLTALKLDSNVLGQAGAKEIAEHSIFRTSIVNDKFGRRGDVIVHYPRVLTNLVLSANDLMDEGAKFVADIVKHNSILLKLDISHNAIGNVGVGMIGKALSHNSTLVSLSLDNNSFLNQGVADFVSKAEAVHVKKLSFSGNHLTEGIGSCLKALALASTSLTKLHTDQTFLAHDESEAIKDVLHRNLALLPDATLELTKKFQVLEKQLLHADNHERLNAEKKTLFQLNQKIEAMRKKTQDIRQGNINEYIRVTNSIAQAQRHKSALEHDIRQVQKATVSCAQMYEGEMARLRSKFDANCEGKALQLATLQQVKSDKQKLIEAERQQIQHCLDDMDVLLDKKHFSIKTHQKYIKDTVELLRTHESYLPSQEVDATWKQIDKDQTLSQEEKLENERTKVAKQRIAIENKEKNKESLLRAARRANFMVQSAQKARKEVEEAGGAMNKWRTLFPVVNKESLEERAKTKILQGIGSFRRKMSGNKSPFQRKSSSSTLSRAPSGSGISRTASDVSKDLPSLSRQRSDVTSRSPISPTRQNSFASPLSSLAAEGHMLSFSSTPSSTPFGSLVSQDGHENTASPIEEFPDFKREISSGIEGMESPSVLGMIKEKSPEKKSKKPKKSPKKKKTSSFDGDPASWLDLSSSNMELEGSSSTQILQKTEPLDTRYEASTQESIIRPYTSPDSLSLIKHEAADDKRKEPETTMRASKSGKEGQGNKRVDNIEISDPNNTHEQANVHKDAASESVEDQVNSVEESLQTDSQVRREGPQSEGIVGKGSVRMLLKAGGKVDTTILRGLMDAQNRFLVRVNYDKGNWMTKLERQQETRRPLAIGFMETRRIRRLAELEEQRATSMFSVARTQHDGQRSNLKQIAKGSASPLSSAAPVEGTHSLAQDTGKVKKTKKGKMDKKT